MMCRVSVAASAIAHKLSYSMAIRVINETEYEAYERYLEEKMEAEDQQSSTEGRPSSGRSVSSAGSAGIKKIK